MSLGKWSGCVDMLGMKRGTWIGILVMFLLVAMPIASAEIYKPIDQRYIETGENSNWYFIKIQKVTGADYVGISKNNKGYIGLAVNGEYVGYMFFVPAFKHPVNSNWYLCPILDTGTYNVNLGSNTIQVGGSGTYTCYRYDNPTLTGSADMTINELMFTANPDASIKITANVTVTGVSPSDTGFGYIFVPTDQSKLRYADVLGVLEDLAGSDRDLSVDSGIEFFDASQNWIGHSFFWSDMPAGTNTMMKVVTLGSKKGLLVGTYGYGASNNIYVDPIYSVDYSPEPGEYLISGNVSGYNDSQFASTPDISAGLSDSSDATTYLVEEFSRVIVPGGTVAYDGFECGAFNCGTGWVNTWTYTGTPEITTTNTPIGTYHMRVDNGWTVWRNVSTINLNTCNVSFYAKTQSLEVGDTCTFYYFDGTTDHQLLQLDYTTTDGAYVKYSYEVCNAYGRNANSGIRLASVGGNGDYCYVDNVNVTGDEYRYYLNGTAIVGKWNQTYNATYDYYLRLRKTSTGTDSVRVYAYYDSGAINQTMYVDDVLSGTGWFNINVSGLVDYETNVAGFNHTALRFYSFDHDYISEMYLRKEVDDAEAPVFTACQVNDTTLTNNQVARFQCNVTDNIGVDYVNVTIEGVTYNVTKVDDTYYYDWECTATNPSVDWTLIQVEDLAGNYNSTNPGLSVSCTYDIIPPVVTIYAPGNTSYSSLTTYLNVSANEVIDAWWYSLNGGANQTFTPNTTITGIENQNHIVVYANDTLGNIGSASKYFWLDTLAPIITIYIPQNTSYNGTVIPLKVDANEPITLWWYKLNGGANQYFTPNTTIYVNDGLNFLQVFGLDTVGRQNSSSVYFSANSSLANFTVDAFYPPLGQVGENITIYAIIRDSGEVTPNATVNITLDGSTVSMSWDSVSQSYLVYWIPSSTGSYDFLISASDITETGAVNGTINITDTFEVCFSLWNDINMTTNSSYKNEFAWVYAVHKIGDPTLKRLFDVGEKFSCSPQSPYPQECMWHAEYINGTACLDLNFPGNYTFYIVGNNIEWVKDIGTGYRADCDYCNYHAIQKRFLLNLGNYHFNGDIDETFDLYYSPTELYYSGAFFGFLTSWVMLIIYGIIALVSFIGILWATGSLKSAMAGLVLLPTIIHLVLTFTL